MDFQDQLIRCVGYQQITSLGTAASLTVPPGARYAHLQAEVADIRYRADAVNPTASVGMLLSKDSDGLWCNADLDDLRFIQVTAGAILNVSYYG